VTPEECGKTSLSGWTGLVFRQRVMLARMERVLAHLLALMGLARTTSFSSHPLCIG